MALWCRVGQSKFKHLYRHFKSVPYGSLLNSTVSNTKPCVSPENPYLSFLNKPTDFFNKVRFFAAPVQVKQKEEKDQSGPRINEQIKAEFVRLVMENEHAIVSRCEALDRARKLKLDLVEVQGKTNPPVCKIMDFHKEKYQKKLREKDRAKVKSEGTLRTGTTKEIRFSGKIEQKDLQMKADMVKRLMEQGYRVKCTARGTADALEGTLTRLSALIEDIAVVESGPHLGKDGAYVIVRHVKFGLSKKGGGKKYQAAGDTSPKVEKVTSNSKPVVDSGGPIEDLEVEDIHSGEADQAISSKAMQNENLRGKRTPWSVSDSSDDFGKVFNFSEDAKRVASNPTIEPMADSLHGASIRSDSDGSVWHPKQVFDSTKAHPIASQSDPNMTENRYKKNNTVNRFSTSKVMDDKGMGTRDPVRFQPRFSNYGRQPPTDMNFSPPTRESGKAEVKAPLFKNSKLPLDDTAKQESSGPGAPSTPRPGYGIFSAQSANSPGKQSVAGEVNRNREENPYSARNPAMRGFTANQNPPGSKSGGSQPEIDKGGQGGWGIFGRESSNLARNSLSKEN
ncbi:hypothetical protein FEM48_Zijuj09G0166400 [Ziziphus jujuba var. spinosa]|uniref:Translation initiation factor 3 N-terminal domain-containing protein n=1 Tax=Ziziphus jujuba var. spinosa TaxID=714518 RepID=A0A978UU38_ZIZJJ|nr:hypothetical protein FEM48_Zijuj09G0166400 [Ziziphus jujuba var. spinosa]